jgi:GT2 family glycosyltransferase
LTTHIGDYAIVIPFHSNTRSLGLALATLAATVPAGIEILVVFNNDDAAALPHIDRNRVRILDLGRTAGYARAANAGAAAARARTLIFSDADTYYADGWFERLTAFHAATPRIGVASPKLLDPKTGRVGDFGIGFTRYNAPHPQMDVLPGDASVRNNRRVQAACSASMMVDAGLFKLVGGFDEELHNFYTDLDFCLRLNERGYENWVVADAIAYHSGSSAHTFRDPYRADVKAVFAEKNHHRIAIDMASYFAASIERFRSSHEHADSFVVIDLSTIVDRAWHHDLLRQWLPVVAVYEYGYAKRDAAEISLLDHLGLTVLDFRTATLYFVDRFIALRPNVMWLSMRSRGDDLVIDRNANIARVDEVVRGEI